MLRIGLTGNYGCGKSTVLKMFQHCGAMTFNTDTIVSSLLREDDVLMKIRKRFGDVVFRKDGRLDKKRLASIVFADASARRALERILHPLVFKTITMSLKRRSTKNTVVIIEAPVLFERHYERRFHRVITVKTDEHKALERLEKEGIKRQDAIPRIQAQLPMRDKIERSDFVIDNNGSLEQTERQVRTIYQKLIEESSRGDCRRP